MRRMRTMFQHEIIDQSAIAMQGLRSHPRMRREEIIRLDLRYEPLKASNEHTFIKRS